MVFNTILKYIGMYFLAGLVLHFGWTAIMEIWMYRRVGKDGFHETIQHYIALKTRLYDKHAGLREAKMMLDSLCAMGPGGWFLMILMSFVIWPIGVYEDIAVYSDTVDYVLAKTTKESSGV